MSTEERYLVLARKYRPQNFNHLYYGQDPLAKTISYAIQNHTLAQGYLFTGIRGIGKTSSARIIAKTANCTNPEINQTQGYINACETCANCSSFNQGAHPDIVEIDAASHTGVDDVRELINSAEYKPMLAKYKFYIIDEVHMLSKSAFNALLKLLEEPPAHAIFILATTEVNKIPLTIISRCQRFDLKRMSVQTLLQLTQEICQKENIQHDQEALKLLCSKADGSARDALSLLDQANALARTLNSTITTEIIQQLTNSSDIVIILQYLEAIAQNDSKKALNIITQINNAAPGLNYFFEDVLSAVAYLSKGKLINDYHDPLWGTYNKDLHILARQFSLSRLTILWQIISKVMIEFKTTHNVLLSAEMLTVRLLYATLVPELSTKLTTPTNAESAPIIHTSTPIPPNTLAATPNIPRKEVMPQPKAQLTNKTQNTTRTTPLSLADFLSYLKNNRHFDILYNLMNETSIVKFQDNLFSLQQTTIDKKLKTQLEELLYQCSGTKWNVVINSGEIVHTLKEQLIHKATKSNEWQEILASFEDATIIDIKP